MPLVVNIDVYVVILSFYSCIRSCMFCGARNPMILKTGKTSHFGYHEKNSENPEFVIENKPRKTPNLLSKKKLP